MKNILTEKMNAEQPHFIIFEIAYNYDGPGINGARTEIIVGEQAFRKHAFDFFLEIHEDGKNDPNFVRLKAMNTQEIIAKMRRYSSNAPYVWAWDRVLIVTGNNINILEK